ncbi:hypothetical protein FRC12_008112 [Ceratobasidium sp. 428]|nr:hypothetical protein FRC12_008112 [Ceratobasidium sp. 428]
MWIRTFLSPSLTSIVVEALPPEASLPVVPGLVAKSLLEHIEKACHGLQHLQLFSETGVPGNYDASFGRNDFGIVEFWEPSFFERLTGLRLRKLGCTIELISPKWIHLLSEFPLLKGLDLYAAYPSVPAFADSRPAFLPCLGHFGIHFTLCDEIEKVAKLGFLDGLKSLRISFRECRTLLEDGWERDTILLISRNSPNLTKLYMDFEGTADTAPEMSSFRPLGALPITEVYLQGSVYMEENELEDLGVIWPKVTRFEMRNWSEGMELGELRHFTKLPRIRHLILVVSWQGGIPQSIAPAKPSYTLQTFEVSTNDFYADFDVSLLAQYMLSLWPNLESVYWPETDDQSNTTMEALNNMIVSQRTLNRLKSRIAEEYGLDVLDKLLK